MIAMEPKKWHALSMIHGISISSAVTEPPTNFVLENNSPQSKRIIAGNIFY
jgi:hypothetical protein